MKQRWFQFICEEIEAIVLRTKVDPQRTLWEAILPPEFQRLSLGLEQVDRLLDDPVFFEPFVAFFDPEIGRPPIPIETYLRARSLYQWRTRVSIVPLDLGGEAPQRS